MSEGEDNLVALQDLLDGAVLDPGNWVAVCDELANSLDGVGSVFVPEDTSLIGPWLVTSASLEPLVTTIMRDGWLARNYRRKAIPMLRSRGYATDLDISDASTMRSEPFYADLLASQGLGCFVGLQFSVGSQSWFAAVERPIDAPLPDDALLAKADRARAMLSAAAKASSALGTRRFETWRDVVSEPGRAVLALNRSGHVIDANAAADQLLGDALVTKNRLLHVSDPSADVAFQTLVLQARSGRHDAALAAPVVWRGPGGQFFMAETIPASPRLIDFHNRVAVLVVVRPVDRLTPSLTDALRRFGLSDAETRLALALYDGLSVIEYAEMLGNSQGTVRNQLKSVFRKTGVRRQAELVVWMSRLSV